MRNTICLTIILLLCVSSCVHAEKEEQYCRIGAFVADMPTIADIEHFKEWYGKKPALIMVFIDWEKHIDPSIIEAVYSQGSTLFVSWEPWHAYEKQAIDYDGLLQGTHDEYIYSFAHRLKNVHGEVLLRFAHEMNGNWYPWNGEKLGKDTYVALFRYVRNIFNQAGVNNVSWVFSINWENIPRDNNYDLYYPGDEYVDYIGIDGYNWGSTQSWSRWLEFKDLFIPVYEETVERYNKPIIISEFSSTSSGGNKAAWIQKAFTQIKKMQNLRACVLFNVDKETDWHFAPDSDAGKALRKQLQDSHFIGSR